MGNSTCCQKLYFVGSSGAAPARLKHPHTLCHGKGEGLGQGFAFCVPTFIDNMEQVNSDSKSIAVSSAMGHMRYVEQAGVKHREEQGHGFPADGTPELFEDFCRLVQGHKVMFNLPGAVILSLSERVQLELPTWGSTSEMGAEEVG